MNYIILTQSSFLSPRRFQTQSFTQSNICIVPSDMEAHCLSITQPQVLIVDSKTKIVTEIENMSLAIFESTQNFHLFPFHHTITSRFTFALQVYKNSSKYTSKYNFFGRVVSIFLPCIDT